MNLEQPDLGMAIGIGTIMRTDTRVVQKLETDQTRQEKARRAVANRIAEVNPHEYSQLVNGVVDEFGPYAPSDKKAVIYIMGWEKDGKTALIEGLLDDLKEKLGKTPDKSFTPPVVVTHDFIDSIICYEKLHPNAGQLGKKSEREYTEIDVIDEGLTDAFFALPGQAVLIKEGILTQSFKQNGDVIGIPRNNLRHMRTRKHNGNAIYIAFMDVNETFRRKNMNSWYRIAEASVDDILDIEADQGILSDTQDAFTVKAKYDTATPTTFEQHTKEIVRVVWELTADQPAELGRAYNFQEDVLVIQAKEKPSVMSGMRKQMIERARAHLSGLNYDPRVITLKNIPLPRSEKRGSSPTFLKEHSLIDHLKGHAVKTSDFYTLTRLEQLGVVTP